MPGKSAEDLIARARALAPEAVFGEPWEARAFAVAVALCEAGQFQWGEIPAESDCRNRRSGKTGRTTKGGTDYYLHWLDALTRLLDAKGIVLGPELEARTADVGPPPPPQDSARASLGRTPRTLGPAARYRRCIVIWWAQSSWR